MNHVDGFPHETTAMKIKLPIQINWITACTNVHIKPSSICQSSFQFHRYNTTFSVVTAVIARKSDYYYYNFRPTHSTCMFNFSRGTSRDLFSLSFRSVTRMRKMESHTGLRMNWNARRVRVCFNPECWMKCIHSVRSVYGIFINVLCMRFEQK